MSTLFKWVHLSDIHFRPQKDNGFNTTELKSSLPQYLRSHVQSADALIITGDYRFAPDKEDNPQSVCDFIKQLCEALDLDISHVFLVPGNHDLDRSEVRSDVIKGLRNRYTPSQGVFDQERLENLENNFKYFHELQKILYGKDAWESVCVGSNPHYFVPLENCNLLLINTALTAGAVENDHVNDERRLLLGSSYLAAAVHDIENNKPIIAIGHHGLNYLEGEEYKTCTQFMDREGIRLYLCGHDHTLWNSTFGNQGKSITVGCLMQADRSVEAGFSVGELLSDGSVDVRAHKWDLNQQKWYLHPPGEQHYENLYHSLETSVAETEQEFPGDGEKEIIQREHPFSLAGYVLLGGRGIDGIKYIWERDGRMVESLAFNRRLKDSQDLNVQRISAYTCSVSYGCRLSCSDRQCLFCETGTAPYRGDISAEDIALQNIFMAGYDADCPSFPQVRGNDREFAFMGQGEPGFCYPAVRRAIQLTDYAMDRIRQRVYRYVISTCGITDFVPILVDDIRKGVFKNRVTLHFSLHAVGDDRTLLMPINAEYDYKRFIAECVKLYEVTKEKIGVGILMFDEYHFAGRVGGVRSYSLTKTRLERVLQELDRDVFRIDLCDVNRTSCGNQRALSNERATKLLKLVMSKGFEAKLFSSFGDSEHSGCGMLSSSTENITDPGNKTNSQFNKAVELLNEAIVAVG